MTRVECQDDTRSTRYREKWVEFGKWAHARGHAENMKRGELGEDCTVEDRTYVLSAIMSHTEASAETNEGMPRRPAEIGPVNDTRSGARPQQCGKRGETGVEARFGMVRPKSDLSLPRACLAWRDDRAPGF